VKPERANDRKITADGKEGPGDRRVHFTLVSPTARLKWMHGTARRQHETGRELIPARRTAVRSSPHAARPLSHRETGTAWRVSLKSGALARHPKIKKSRDVPRLHLMLPATLSAAPHPPCPGGYAPVSARPPPRPAPPGGSAHVRHHAPDAKAPAPGPSPVG
jgi:hypothetical protein